MAVQKYKPRSTTHMQDDMLNRTLSHTERVVREGREAVARARRLVEDSQHAIERAEQLRRKRT